MMPAPETTREVIADLLQHYTGPSQCRLRAQRVVEILDAEIRAMEELPRPHPAGYSLGDAAALLDQEHHALIDELIGRVVEIRQSRNQMVDMVEKNIGRLASTLGRKDQGPGA